MANKEIDLAEGLRVKGELAAAIAICRREADLSPGQIDRIPREKLPDLMRFWRIWSIAAMGLYSRQWDGNKADRFLTEVKDVILRYCFHTRVQQEAAAMKTDSEGHEYQMQAEMYRDKGRMCLKLAELTGLTCYLDSAIRAFQSAINCAEQGTSAWAVAIMEKEITERQSGNNIDWGVFTPAYEAAVNLSPQAGGWDRMAAVSWWYTKEALIAGKKEQLQVGLENLKVASQPLGVNWIIRYPIKEVALSLLVASRRLTYHPKLTASA